MLLIALLLAACEQEPRRAPQSAPPPSAPPSLSPQASPTPSGLPGCAAGEELPGRLTGDVDGDGAPDEVTLAAPARPDCPYAVIAGTAAGPLTGELARDPDGFTGGLPALNTLADLDRDGDAEVAVDVHAGASTVFLALFDASGDALVRIAARAGPARGELFAYGGSVGHLDGIDCASEQGPPAGGVVITSAVPRGARYLVRRSFYELVAGVLEHRPELAERHLVGADDLGQFAELAAAPFASCAP